MKRYMKWLICVMLAALTAVSAGCGGKGNEDDGRPGRTIVFDDGITETSGNEQTDIPAPRTTKTGRSIPRANSRTAYSGALKITHISRSSIKLRQIR